MPTHKEDIQTLEYMMLDYYSIVKEGEKFTLFVFFDLLSKMESDLLHSKILNKNESGRFYLLFFKSKK